MNNEFKFWDKYMNLEEEELKLFNFVLQFDFGGGNSEYSCEELKTSGVPAEDALAALKFIICGYSDGADIYLAFLDIDTEGGVGYTFIQGDSETPVEIEDAEIVAANIYAIASDAIVSALGR